MEKASIPGFRGTRGEALRAIKRLQPVAAKTLSENLGLTPNALRRHLKALEQDGLLTYESESHGVGAPAHLYRLTTEGERLFPNDYESVLGEALTALRQHGGEEAIVQLFSRRFVDLSASAKPELRALPLAERSQRLAEMLSSLGHMAEVGHDPVAIREYHCAVKSVAVRFPELCDAEERFIEEMLGVPVVRQEHIAKGARCCAYCVAGDGHTSNHHERPANSAEHPEHT